MSTLQERSACYIEQRISMLENGGTGSDWLVGREGNRGRIEWAKEQDAQASEGRGRLNGGITVWLLMRWWDML